MPSRPNFRPIRRLGPSSGYPTEVGHERTIVTTSLGFVPKEEAKRISQLSQTPERLLELRVFRSSSRFVVGAGAPTEIGTGVRKCASHRCRFGPRAKMTLDCAWVCPPLHRPGARHATRKLMAPPLRFFVLSAFLSLGSRNVSLCLADTIRSQGFSPSQRFDPPRAWRLCFASLPPIGFLAFRAFPA
jgi:hypothetical protein